VKIFGRKRSFWHCLVYFHSREKRSTDLNTMLNNPLVISREVSKIPRKLRNIKVKQGGWGLSFVIFRAQTDPGKAGKAGKTINFEKNQRNPGKNFFFFSRYSGKLREFFSRQDSRLKLTGNNMINAFLSFALYILYHS